MRSPGVGGQITGMPTTIGTPTTFTGTTTFNKTAEDTPDTAETIAKFGVGGITDGGFWIENGTSGDGAFITALRGFSAGTSAGVNLIGQGTTDTGTNPLIRFTSKIGSGTTAATSRSIFDMVNGGIIVLAGVPLNSGANLALSWGTQASANPAFTTRSSGTRLVLYSAIGASDVDYALGVGPNGSWYSVARATSIYRHSFFGGTTEVAAVRGDGLIYAAQAGGGFGVKEGSNATMGTATLVGGTATVSTTKVTASSRIFLTKRVGGGTRGIIEVGTITAATSFVINSVDSAGALVADTSTISWIIIEPAP